MKATSGEKYSRTIIYSFQDGQLAKAALHLAKTLKVVHTKAS